ncbi:hypothetical protein Dimus_008251 [Dionaea muscipula]
MELDGSPSNAATREQKVETLRGLTSSISKLSASSRGLPSDKDFHFYYNFDEFRVPVDQLASGSSLMLQKIGSSKQLRDRAVAYPEDIDDAYEWLINFNDEVLERFDMAVDEFSRIRKGEEVGVVEGTVDGNGFQLVYGNKKKKGDVGVGEGEGKEENLARSGVRMAETDKRAAGTKAKVPFHIPTIKRPQDEFNILVNNSNQPFQHVWLHRSEDDSRFIHPLENLSVLDFVDNASEGIEPVNPLPIESTPFKLIEEVKDLKLLVSKLRSVNEFSVDLEHNQYRSFQGLTCLMQISTRTEDFVIDTLKLRVHIGPYLREVFKDPSKKKVMHGADRDIVWLQRDFGIYVCNLFDTGQASRVLKMERYSLQYLLQHLCGVTANKEYQNADWRLRPLPLEMLRYARDDTHYLLYIYDLLRARLMLEPPESEESDPPLVEVYKRSYNICMQLYEKELLTEKSYLHTYGLQGANFSGKQLSIVAGLHEWRDIVARAEDESTGYILPNKSLLEIAKQMPVTTGKLRQLVKSKLPYVERNLGSVVNIIRHSIQNAAEFQAVAEQLKEGRNGVAPESAAAEGDSSEALQLSQASVGLAAIGNTEIKNANSEHGKSPASADLRKATKKFVSHEINSGNTGIGISFPDNNRRVFTKKDNDVDIPKFLFKNLPETWKTGDISTSALHHEKATAATVPVLKKPSRAFGALVGNSASKNQTYPLQKGNNERLMEQIKSSVKLPFHSFSGPEQLLKQDTKVPSFISGPQDADPVMPASTSKQVTVVVKDALETKRNSEDIIMIEDGSDPDETHAEESAATASEKPEAIKDPEDDFSLVDEVYEELSLSELSSSLQKCFESINRKEDEKHHKPEQVQVTPFNYEEAKRQVNFWVDVEKPSGGEGGSSNSRKSGFSGRAMDNEGKLAPGKRRQAFPATGNRSATFL